MLLDWVLNLNMSKHFCTTCSLDSKSVDFIFFEWVFFSVRWLRWGVWLKGEFQHKNTAVLFLHVLVCKRFTLSKLHPLEVLVFVTDRLRLSVLVSLQKWFPQRHFFFLLNHEFSFENKEKSRSEILRGELLTYSLCLKDLSETLEINSCRQFLELNFKSLFLSRSCNISPLTRFQSETYPSTRIVSHQLFVRGTRAMSTSRLADK